MNRFLDQIIRCSFLVSLQLASVTAFCQQKAVFILLDGIPADVIERVSTPVLDEIAESGGYTHSYVGGERGQKTETPTISAPGYMNLITGTWGNKHNVWGNEVKAPDYEYWNIFRILKSVNPEKKIAIFSTWEDNRTKLIGEGLQEAGNIKMDYAFDGFENDLKAFPHDDKAQYIFDIDEQVSKESERYIRSEGPDLSWVYLEFTDDMGHRFGDGPEMYEAVERADLQVGRIWSAVKFRGQEFQEDWMIVVTTDHGRSAEDGRGHGGQSIRERTTWIVTNKSNLKASFYNDPPIVDILPSLLEHLKIEAPSKISSQFDGHSFLKKK